MVSRALSEQGACSEDTTSSCFARLRAEEATGLYFPVEDREDKET